MYFYTSKVGDTIPPRLLEISEQVKRGEKPSPERVRTFLSWFGVERRGPNVSYDIQQMLKNLGLKTNPNFIHTYIDSEIEFIPFQKTEDGDIQTNTKETPISIEIDDNNTGYMPPTETISVISENILSEVEFTDPTYRIGKLESANNRPISVKPEGSLQEIVTKMLANDFSQLPVMTSERDVKGVVSWASIGKRLALGMPCNIAKDCMESHHEISADASLFYAIDAIIEYEYVLVRDTSRVITGIVTTTDLSMQFLQLSEPFLLIGEIENHIRKLINRKFTRDDFFQARNPVDEDRQVENISDLTFGEYIRLIENQTQWDKLNINLDRAEFIGLLHEVRDIRNDVMHFDPDGVSETGLSKLRNFVEFLQSLNKMGII